MGVFQNNLMGAAAAAASASTDFYSHQIANSMRFAGVQDLDRSRSSAGSTTTSSISFWVKRNKIGAYQYILHAYADGNNYVRMTFLADDTLEFQGEVGGAMKFELETTQVFRDASAWYHIVGILDFTNGTQGNRAQLYVNGERVTAFDTETYPADASQTNVLCGANTIRYGDDSGNNYTLYSYLAEIVLIDGTAQAVGDFGETKNGVWIPKDPSGLTFGTTGHYLKFESSSDLGNDSSGNNNDFTPYESTAAHDQMLDSPTFNSSSNGGNFPTYNPLLKPPSGLALAEGNLKATLTSDDNGIMTNWQVPVTGKWYWEVDVDDIATDHGVYIGVMPANTDLTINQEQNDLGLVYYNLNGNSILKGTRSSYGATWAEGDIISIAVDRTADTLQFYKNGAGQGTIDISSLDEEFFCYMGYTGGSGPCSTILNFGQDGTFAGNVTAGGNSDGTGYGNFKYSVPSGFLAICSGNQPVADEVDPAQTDDNYPQKTFTALAYSGNNGGSFTTGFQPDLVWVKRRDGGQSNGLWDSTRGTTKILISNETDAEATSSGLTAFGSTGYTMGTYYNQSGNTYASWSWRANGGTTSTNTQGDINSTVQVDPSGCFSIVKYTGGLSSSGVETVGHGLSTAPSLFITKSLEKTGNWWVFSDGQTNWNYGMNLNSTGASTDKSGNGSMSAPTSTVFSTNYTDGLNENGNDLIAYVFANCEGYIKSGSYVGNGDGSDGTFVYTGFKPAWIMVKKLTSNNWRIEDNARDTYNPAYHMLVPNSTAAEDAYTDGTDYNDFLSNGFKLARGGDAVNWNASGATYIYLAMAHNPFKYATAR